MRIGIVGYGYVGSAVAGAHDRNVLMIHDPYKFQEWEHYTLEQLIEHCGWIYLCLPTSSKEDGGCDTGILEDVLLKLKDYEGIVISKSTAPPKFYIDIFNQCGKNKKYKFRFVHMPEFLTEKNSLQDYMHPQIIVVGGSANDRNYIVSHVITSDYTYKNKTNIVKTDIGSAAAMKYYSNSWLATKVIYNNQFAKWCSSQGVDWNEVTEVLKMDRRLGNTHYQVPGNNGEVGYGGSCFPKDISAILKIAEDNNVDMSLLKFQTEINETIRKAQQEEIELEKQRKSLSQGRRRTDQVPRGPMVRPPRRNR